MKSIKGQAFRFLVGGTANTLLTYLIYLALLTAMSYRSAYTVSFVIGILSAFLINSCYVFRTSLAWRKMVQYPVLYVFQYIIGLLTLAVLVDYVGLDDRVAPLLTLAVLLPITFMSNRWLLTKSSA